MRRKIRPFCRVGGRRRRARAARGAGAPLTTMTLSMTLLLLLRLLPVLGAASAASDLTVINSLGPVRLNETVASIVPNLEAQSSGDVDIQIRGEEAATVAPISHAEGIVHWVYNASEVDEIDYRLCSRQDGSCGPSATLNAAELWWAQCVGSSAASRSDSSSIRERAATEGNGLACAGGGVLRIFGKALAFDEGRCSPYAPYVHGGTRPPPITPIRLRLNQTGAEPIELAATTQSCYDATFVLPSAVAAGSYTLEVQGNLPSSTWQQARDPDQHTLTIPPPEPAPACDAAGHVITATSVNSLQAALVAAKTRKGGATIVVHGTIELSGSGHDFPFLTLPQCTVLKGGTNGLLRWKGLGGSLGVDCGMKNRPVIAPDPTGGGTATVEGLSIEAVALRGCTSVLGTTGGSGFTLRDLNVTMLASMHKAAVFGSVVSASAAKHLLIEGCSFLHCGNNTPGDAHSGVNAPILNLAATSDSVVRNNLWQVGLSGWHFDRSWHIIQESNVFTGYFDNNKSRPLPNFDGSFWFSSYGQGPFPGAGRFFYANTTQNERPHTKPQVGGGESFTLDGGNNGGYFGNAKAGITEDGIAGSQLTMASDICWQHVGGYSKLNCSTTPKYGTKTGHAVLILSGPGHGQWRRVVDVGGERNRTITLSSPFSPPPTDFSVFQIGPMRGQIMLVGNDFVYGGGAQLYAACYDCIVAENHFQEFGLSNWGRAPHGVGWQPNINALMVDNVFDRSDRSGGAEVLGCSATCSGSYNDADEEKICHPAESHSGEWIGCSGNATSQLGRDCTPFSDDDGTIGGYKGAVNMQIAWRRNSMAELTLTGREPANW